ncbi:MAG TPA: hypothetical protein VJ885_02360 [Thermoanaerobaculia bacterium]|nr:hypothetical protein [Thermoanaerobaculia bacterium]
MSKQNSLSIFRTILLLGAVLFVSGLPARAHMEPMNGRQMVHQSRHIVVAKAESARARWNDRHTLIVTDYVLAVEDRLRGEAPARIRITMPGGTLDGETHHTCLTTHLSVGSRYLLFLGDLEQRTFTAVTGAAQGVYREPRGREAEFAGFVQGMRSFVAEALAAPAPEGLPRSTAEQRTSLPVKAFDPSPVHMSAIETASPRSEEMPMPALPLLENIEQGVAETAETESRNDPRSIFGGYTYQRAPSRPIVINQLPSNFSVSPHDQYMMSIWNRYAANLFRIRTQPTGTWAWRNGVFDLAGFPPNSQMQSQFDYTWGATTLGICFSRWTTGPIIEADIALNPAYSWTLNERIGTTQGSAQSFRQTMLHELGHAWGLKHPWETQNVWWDSVMNYAPQAYRFAHLFADDATAVRTAYPGTTLRDLLISGYRTRDNTSSNNATYLASKPTPSTVIAGNSFTLTNPIKVENSGTTNIVNPKVEIYLVPQRLSWNNSIYLKTVSFTTTVAPFSTVYLNLGSIRIPTSVANGSYFVGYYVRDTNDGYQPNNSAWSDWNGKVTVTR